MTATEPTAGRLRAVEAEAVRALLEGGPPGATDPLAVLAHQFPLHALDRGELDRLLVWPVERPVGVLYAAGSGTIMPAGDPQAAPALAEAAGELGWRVLVGPAEAGEAILAEVGRGLFRRRPRARDQRFMVCTEVPDVAAPAGLRPADPRDLDALVDLACRLHVEDAMGPRIPESARGSVRARLRESVAGGDTWVVARRGRVVAKVDVSLRSRSRGAQLAGVYVSEEARGQGIATRAVGAVAAGLLRQGLPGVTLHVRADNAPGLAAYRRAGFVDAGRWTLALR